MKYKKIQEVYNKSIIEKSAPVLGPKSVHIDLNNLCQLDCVTCWNYSPDLDEPKTKEWKQRQMDKNLLFDTLSQLHELKTERIILSGGGEIFYHPDIMEIIRKVKSYNFKLTLITNALAITKEQAKEIVDLKVETILANVSSASAETYVNYHPNQKVWAYSNLIDILTILSPMKDLKLVQVINNVNYKEIVNMINVTKQLNCGVQFKLASMSAPGTEKYMLNDSQIEFLVKNIEQYIHYAENSDLKSHNLGAFKEQLFGQSSHKFPIENIGCYAGYLYSRIDIEGQVKFCCKNFIVGDLNNNSFKDIWFNSEQLTKYRKDMNDGNFYNECNSCGNWTMNYKKHIELKKEI